MEEDVTGYKSTFLPDVDIILIFKGHEDYDSFAPLFNNLGYGFVTPDSKKVFIDGEVFLNEDGFNGDVLKFIEAHEVSHIILGHDQIRNQKDEMEADLGAYLLLRKFNFNDSIEILIENFEGRHGVPFDTSLLEDIEDRMSEHL
jgi:hypothetical protein